MQIKCKYCKKNFRIKLEPWLDDYITRYNDGDCDEYEALMYFPTLKRNLQSKHAFELITRQWCFDCWHDSWAESYGYCPLHEFPKNK
jgi:hypothetical protein